MKNELKEFPHRTQTPREANMVVTLADAIEDHYAPQIIQLAEALEKAKAEEETFAQQHGARLGEVTALVWHNPDLGKFKEENPEEYKARYAEFKALGERQQQLADARSEAESDLTHAQGCQRLNYIEAGIDYGSREGFRLGLLYALSITPESALAALKAVASNEEADRLIFRLFAEKDPPGAFELSCHVEEGGGQ